MNFLAKKTEISKINLTKVLSEASHIKEQADHAPDYRQYLFFSHSDAQY